jgi:hypothetical protein
MIKDSPMITFLSVWLNDREKKTKEKEKEHSAYNESN